MAFLSEFTSLYCVEQLLNTLQYVQNAALSIYHAKDLTS